MSGLIACFLGVDVPGRVIEALSGPQREARRAAKAAGGALHTVGKRSLHIRLAELEPIPADALEAVLLAAERVAARHVGFTIDAGPVELVPAPDGAVLRLPLLDPDAALAELSNALSLALAAFGFELAPPPNPWAVDVAAISGCNFGELTLDAPSEPVTLTVSHLVLLTTGLPKTRRPASDVRFPPRPVAEEGTDPREQPWRPYRRVALAEPVAPGPSAHAPSPDHLILAALDERLEARNRARRQYDDAAPPETTGVP